MRQGFKSSCEVTTSGKSGNITCHFEEDISKTKRDFSILRYDLKDDQIVGLEPGTNYTMSVVALNALGESSPESNVMLASTKIYGCASCVFCILVRRYTEKRKPDVAERRGQELYGFRVDNGVRRVGEKPEESF
nr:hypothetical protein BaRGS_010788 [Batillaria attramentaria]